MSLENCYLPYENFIDLNEILKIVTDTLKELKIPYWIDNHTLKGAIQFGNIEPWVKYTEISCMEIGKKYNKFKTTLEQFNLKIINSSNENINELNDILELNSDQLGHGDTIFIKKGSNKQLNYRNNNNSIYNEIASSSSLSDSNNDHFKDHFKDHFNFGINKFRKLPKGHGIARRHGIENVQKVELPYELKLTIHKKNKQFSGSLSKGLFNNNGLVFPLETMILGKWKVNVPNNPIGYLNNIEHFHHHLSNHLKESLCCLNKLNINNWENKNLYICNLNVNGIYSNTKILGNIGEYYKAVHKELFNSFFTNVFYTQKLPFEIDKFKQIFNSLSNHFKKKRIESGHLHRIINIKIPKKPKKSKINKVSLNSNKVQYVEPKFDYYKNIFPIIQRPQRNQLVNLGRTHSIKFKNDFHVNQDMFWLRYHEYYFLLFLSLSPVKGKKETTTFLNILIFSQKKYEKKYEKNYEKQNNKFRDSNNNLFKIINHKIVHFSETGEYNKTWIEINLQNSNILAKIFKMKNSRKSRNNNSWIYYNRTGIFYIKFERIHHLFTKNSVGIDIIVGNKFIKPFVKKDSKNKYHHHNWFKKLQNYYGPISTFLNNDFHKFKSQINIDNQSQSIYKEIYKEIYKGLSKFQGSLHNPVCGNDLIHKKFLTICTHCPMVEYDSNEYIGIGQMSVNVSHGFFTKWSQGLKDLINFNEKMNKPFSILKFMFFYTINKFTKKLHRISNAFITKNRINVPIGIVKNHHQAGKSLFTHITIIYKTSNFKNDETLHITTLSKATIDRMLSHTNTENFNAGSYKFFKLV